MPRKFAKRNNGEMVIMNFGSAEPVDAAGVCKPEDIDTCCHVLGLGADLFGIEFGEASHQLEKADYMRPKMENAPTGK